METSIVKKIGMHIVALALAGLTAAVPASAQGDYPTRAIRIINPNPAGSGSDVIVRSFANELATLLGQTVYVENKGGAGSTIGSEAGAKAAPDGYTLTLTSSPLFAIAPLIYTKLNFNPNKDFRSVMVLASFANLALVNPNVPAKTVKELVDLAKRNPGKLTYASSGNGTTTHLSVEMFKQLTGASIVHIPYRGGAPAVTDLIGGQVDIMFTATSSVIQYVKTGALRALAVTGPNRDPALPDVPTMAEAGLPGYEVVAWFSLSVPTATPQAVVDRLSGAAMKAIKAPQFVKAMQDNGFDIVGGTPKQMDKMIEQENQRWGPVVKSLGVRLD
jgi:tripartite-type tricarboxylate transporter receptor subunit TctC